MWIEWGARRIPIGQLGPDFIIPTDPTGLPAGVLVELIVQVDSSVRRRWVRLPDGMIAAAGYRRVRISGP